MNDLEQITKAAGAYAMNCWWQAHDEKDWDKVKDHIIISESVLTRYTGKPIDGKLAGESFVEALKAYDEFTDVLKKKELTDLQSDALQGKMHNYLASYYLAIIGLKPANEVIAKATAGWWTNYAKSRMFYKLGDTERYESACKATLHYLTEEHKLRFWFDEDTAMGLAYLMLSAAHLGHNKKDYAKAEQLMKVYATELFSALSKQN